MDLILWASLAFLALAMAIFAAWIVSLPGSPARAAATPVARSEALALLAALKPPKRQRPVIAIVGINDATETNDYLMPFGILRRADVAEVMALATEAGPVSLFPALRVEPQATVAEFDARYPDGADYVVVPAMSRDDDPTVLHWIKSQAAKGAMIIGVCAGAKVVGAAGLLNGKRATTHWYYLKQMRAKHPSIRYVADRRCVVDGNVATTTGISASMPMSLILIEAIAGRSRAETVARDLGLPNWNACHDSNAFKFTRPFAMTVMGNALAFWRREQFGLELVPGIDEVSLGLVADAWSRTYRSRAVTFAGNANAVETRNGIRIIPDEVRADGPLKRLLPAFGDRRPADVLDQTLRAIAVRYGAPTAEIVAMQLEYPTQDPFEGKGGGQS